MKPLYLLLSFLLLSLPLQAKWIDHGGEVFYSPQTSQTLYQYKDFPAGWWNFIFFKKDKISRDEVCKKINSLQKKPFYFNSCSNPPVPQEWVHSWVRDFPLRNPPLSVKRITTQLNKTLARLSLPLPPSIFEQVRKDPLAAGDAFLQSFQQFYGSPNREDKGWGWIALQMNYSHEDIRQTTSLMDKLRDKGLHFVGPHFAGVENQERIILDLENILSIGLVLLFGLLTFLLWTKRWVFILALPIILTSALLSALLVIFYWGSIHGLTVAFGSALIGISMDYAFHGLMEKHQGFVWRANALSFLTSFLAFSLLCLFDIPFIQQLGIFSAIGLSFSFFFLYILSYKSPKGYHAPPLLQKSWTVHPALALTLFTLLTAGLLLGILFVKQDYSLKNFDYALKNKTEELKELAPLSEKASYALLIEEQSHWEENYKKPSWARQNQIPYIGVQSFSSSPAREKKNLERWVQWACSEAHLVWKHRLSPETLAIFQEFFSTIECENLKERLSNFPETKNYLSPFQNKDKSLFILKGDSEERKEKITQAFPEAFFLNEKVAEFPQLIKEQIYKTLGIILVLCLLLLGFRLRAWALLALLPLLGGSGLCFGYYWLSGSIMTFMSLVGFIILLGLTFDYGIFIASRLKQKKSLEDVWGPLILSGMTSLTGFAPLVLCKHPALQDIGLTLLTGILGALLTSFITAPALAAWAQKQGSSERV